MKKLTFILFMMATFLVANAQTNVLTNGDFENGNATNWRYLKVVNGVVTNLTATMETTDVHGGGFAANVSFPAEAGFNDCVFDLLPSISEGTVYTYKAWAKSLSGAFMLRIHATFYNDGGGVVGDNVDATWILSDSYSLHTFVLPAAPVGATKVNIGFRGFKTDGSGFVASTVNCLIDDVQLLAPQINYDDLLSGTNADFEAGNLSNWVFWADDAVSWATASTDAHTGTNAAELNCAGNSKTKVFQRSPAVTPGQNLTFKAWAKLKTGSAACILRMYATFYNASNGVVSDNADASWVLTNAFTEHSFVLPAAPAGAAYVTIGFHTFKADGTWFNDADVSVIIDDVQLLKPAVTTALKPVNSTKAIIQFNQKSSTLNVVSECAVSSVGVFTLAGQQVKELHSNFNYINISDLKSGIYVVKVVTTGAIVTGKFIKN
jgi:hypothetical protein